MVFGSNLTGLYSGLQPLAAPAKTTTGPFVAAAPAEGMSDTSVAARSALELLQMAGTSASACGYQRSTSHPAVHVRCATRHRHRQL